MPRWSRTRCAPASSADLPGRHARPRRTPRPRLQPSESLSLVVVTTAAASADAAVPDGGPTVTPLLAPREGVPPVVETPHALREAAGGDRRRHRTGRHRRRARVRLPVRPACLPRAAASRGIGHASRRPDRRARPRPAGRGSGRHRVDPARGIPGPARACASSTCAPRRCSTPSSPAACSASHASGSPRCSRTCSATRWPRSTRRPTGRRGRCPSRGCATPRSTSSCSSSCATRWRSRCVDAGKLDLGDPGVRRRTTGPSGRPAHRPLAPHLRHAQGPQAPAAGRGARAVGAP